MEKQFIDFNEKPLAIRLKRFFIFLIISCILSNIAFGLLISGIFMLLDGAILAIGCFSIGIILYLGILITSIAYVQKGMELYQDINYNKPTIGGLFLAALLINCFGVIVFPPITFISLLLSIIILTKGESF